jgi:enoyl-CoA hydratase
MYHDLILEHRGDVDLLTLNRPDVRNALTIRAYSELQEAIQSVRARCIVITGAGSAFCAGDDVSEFMDGGAFNQYLEESEDLYPATAALLTTEVPVIAAVNGVAVGWGMELALLADLRIVSEKARFGELYVQRGLTPDVAGFRLLAQTVGRAEATRLLLTGEIIGATKALEIGLANEVVPHDDIVIRSLELADQIAALPPLAVQRIKAGLRRALDPDWPELGAWTRRTQAELARTQDHRESVAAFTERRPPHYVGR